MFFEKYFKYYSVVKFFKTISERALFVESGCKEMRLFFNFQILSETFFKKNTILKYPNN
jgi:hypothetical protein